MLATVDPPSGTKIRVRESGASLALEWTTEPSPASRDGAAAFLGFWLIGWAVSEIAVLRSLLSGELGWQKLFLLAWLGVWTVGGFFAFRAFRALMARPRPERVVLTAQRFRHQPGTPALPKGRWDLRSLTAKVEPEATLGRAELPALRLEHVGNRQRLTYDLGARRVEIGKALDEREWLAKTIETWRTSSDYRSSRS